MRRTLAKLSVGWLAGLALFLVFPPERPLLRLFVCFLAAFLTPFLVP